MGRIRRLPFCDSNFIPSGRNCWDVNFSYTSTQNGQIDDQFEWRHEYCELGESRTAASQGSMTPNSSLPIMIY